MHTRDLRWPYHTLDPLFPTSETQGRMVTSSRKARVHSYSTRSLTSEHLYTKQSAPNIQAGKAFSHVGVKIWNEIPTNLKS